MSKSFPSKGKKLLKPSKPLLFNPELSAQQTKTKKQQNRTKVSLSNPSKGKQTKIPMEIPSNWNLSDIGIKPGLEASSLLASHIVPPTWNTWFYQISNQQPLGTFPMFSNIPFVSNIFNGVNTGISTYGSILSAMSTTPTSLYQIAPTNHPICHFSLDNLFPPE